MKMEAMSAVNKGLFKESFDKHNQKPLVTFYSTTEALMFSCPCVIVTLPSFMWKNIILLGLII